MCIIAIGKHLKKNLIYILGHGIEEASAIARFSKRHTNFRIICLSLFSNSQPFTIICYMYQFLNNGEFRSPRYDGPN